MSGRDWIEMGRKLDSELDELGLDLAVFAMSAAPVWASTLDEACALGAFVTSFDNQAFERAKVRVAIRTDRITWYRDSLAILRAHGRSTKGLPSFDELRAEVETMLAVTQVLAPESLA